MDVLKVLIGVLVLVVSSVVVSAEPVFDPKGPFVLGEAFPEIPATCETIGHWVDRAPDYDGRISFSITGTLVESHWDGAVAYLIMCDSSDVQVMCVTYRPRDVVPNEVLLLAGGYARVGERQVMLDPCLPYDVDAQ